jgi:CheY-like chemotaxis protein
MAWIRASAALPSCENRAVKVLQIPHRDFEQCRPVSGEGNVTRCAIKEPESQLVLEWLMRALSGLELCRLIRAGQSDGYAYVIVMTSNTEENEIVEGLDAGADDYVVKPFMQESCTTGEPFRGYSHPYLLPIVICHINSAPVES